MLQKHNNHPQLLTCVMKSNPEAAALAVGVKLSKEDEALLAPLLTLALFEKVAGKAALEADLLQELKGSPSMKSKPEPEDKYN